jgi:hypothetical protein
MKLIPIFDLWPWVDTPHTPPLLSTLSHWLQCCIDSPGYCPPSSDELIEGHFTLWGCLLWCCKICATQFPTVKYVLLLFFRSALPRFTLVYFLPFRLLKILRVSSLLSSVHLHDSVWKLLWYSIYRFRPLVQCSWPASLRRDATLDGLLFIFIKVPL